MLQLCPLVKLIKCLPLTTCHIVVQFRYALCITLFVTSRMAECRIYCGVDFNDDPPFLVKAIKVSRNVAVVVWPDNIG